MLPSFSKLIYPAEEGSKFHKNRRTTYHTKTQ